MDADQQQEEEAAAMAEALGFSSFGADPPPGKKRKYNPHTDAVIASTPVHTATAANSIPVGTHKPAANSDEIDLDEDDGNGDKSVQASSDHTLTSRPATSSLPPRPPGLPGRPAPGAGFDHARQGHQHHQKRHFESQHHHNRGGDEKPWYEGYYDNMSNSNPWEKLERKLGLQPRGTWVPHKF